MIKAYCRTNLDDFKQVTWPDRFQCVPRIGEQVEGLRTGSGPGSHPRLRVVAVTHMMQQSKLSGSATLGWEPVIEVELHK